MSTKLNRSHVVHGKRALILPCRARTDRDYQASGLQGVTVEDSMSMVHISYGMKEPGSPLQRSECAILAGLAQATPHDQFNTTIYSNDDRYRGLKGLRTVIFMNEDDMRERGIEQFGLVDLRSFSKDGTERTVYGYRAIRYELPSGCAAGYMPELNVLCGIADFSTQSEQPVTKHLVVEVTSARSKRGGD